MSDKNVHTGHRKRLRSRYLETGMQGFHEHEILELLLFFAIPRADTNPIAHRLLRQFGSLGGVLGADVGELQRVEGVGESAAVLLSVAGAVSKLAMMPQGGAKPRLGNPASAGRLVMSILGRRKYEAFLVICLDAQRRMKYKQLLHEGTVNESVVYPRRVAELALLQGAHSVILAHNHPSGSLQPSAEDVKTTQSVQEALATLGIHFFDHIIVTDEGYYSFAQQRAFTSLELDTQAIAAETDGVDR